MPAFDWVIQTYPGAGYALQTSWVPERLSNKNANLYSMIPVVHSQGNKSCISHVDKQDENFIIMEINNFITIYNNLILIFVDILNAILNCCF